MRRSLRAQDLNSPNGKILRIRPDGSAPPDNPFYDGTNSWRSRVWLYGVRNPFGYSLQAETGEIYFGDVGWNTWEEVNHGGAGTNFGWPCYEGNGPQPFFQSQFPGQCALTSVTPPFHTYDHGSGSAVIGGPVYTGAAYPQQFRNDFFFADYTGNFIKRVVFDSEHRPVSVQPFATDVQNPVALTLGPDGMIYYLSFTTGEIRRIRFDGPVAKAAATPTNGPSPLSVSFSSAGSSNPGGGALSYLWDFGDGATSTAANPSHTYTTSTAQDLHGSAHREHPVRRVVDGHGRRDRGQSPADADDHRPGRRHDRPSRGRPSPTAGRPPTRRTGRWGRRP